MEFSPHLDDSEFVLFCTTCDYIMLFLNEKCWLLFLFRFVSSHSSEQTYPFLVFFFDCKSFIGWKLLITDFRSYFKWFFLSTR